MKTKALVVDNNPVLLKLISSILIREGCEVRTANTGLEALEILGSYHPDIVFTDLIMPQVSGEQLCRIIRSSVQHKNVFIVVISAILVEDRERIVNEVSCNLCIAKGNIQETRLHIQEALQTFKASPGKALATEYKDTRIPEGLQPSAMTNELLHEKHHLSMILGNLDEGILEVSQLGKVVTANIAAQNILNAREEEMIGVMLGDIVDWGRHGEAVYGWVEHQLTGGAMKSYEIFEDLPVFLGERAVTALFLPVAENDSVFGLCILRDITRQYFAEKHSRELDDAFKLVKKMEAMSCMAGGVAHDFNNLLTVICGNLDIVTLEDKGRPQNWREKQQLLEVAKKAALAAVDLTRQISGFSNFGIISRERAEVNALVSDAVQDFFGPDSNAYSVDYRCDECTVSVDPPEISRAINNVLQNAQEASPGKEIKIFVTCCDFKSPQLIAGQYVPAGNYARIDIRDFGPGIEPDVLFKIFDPYYSTKQRGSMKGMGLGLTVVYATLRNHGGYVAVSSISGKETTVSLFLPMVESDYTNLVSQKKGIMGKGSVLLIEPQKQMSEIGQIMLDHLGFSVTAVSSANDAIRELRNLKKNSCMSKPLVIMDISGYDDGAAEETCRQLHEIDPEIQIIAATSGGIIPVMERCHQNGFVNILPKPYSIDCLNHITSRALTS